jgi:hypothetical protein
VHAPIDVELAQAGLLRTEGGAGPGRRRAVAAAAGGTPGAGVGPAIFRQVGCAIRLEFSVTFPQKTLDLPIMLLKILPVSPNAPVGVQREWHAAARLQRGGVGDRGVGEPRRLPPTRRPWARAVASGARPSLAGCGPSSSTASSSPLARPLGSPGRRGILKNR